MKILYNKEVNCFEVREESKTGEITISGLSAGVNKSTREFTLAAQMNRSQ